MPIHDWSNVPAGLFHDFHQTWSIYIRNALNRGLLPRGLTALVEQKAPPKEGEVLAIERKLSRRRGDIDSGGLVTLERPIARFVRQSDQAFYSGKANRIVVRHHLGRIVAVIEIVSPGNKSSVRAIGEFTGKIATYLDEGIHVLVVDLFPPTPRDPAGIHKAIWDQIVDEDMTLPEGKDRILASCEAGVTKRAYVEPIGVGDPVPEMPLFVTEGGHVKVPLEASYLAAWNDTSDAVREVVETGVVPEPDAENG